MAEELLGRTSQDLIGKKLQDEFPEAVGHPFFEAYLEASRTNNVLHLEDYSIVLDRWMFVSVYPSESGLSIFFRDISEQRKAEIELQQSQLQYRLLVERIKDAFHLAR